MRISRLIILAFIVVIGAIVGYQEFRHGDSPRTPGTNMRSDRDPARPSVVATTSMAAGTATVRSASPQPSTMPPAAASTTSPVMASSDGIHLKIVAPESVKIGSDLAVLIMADTTVALHSYTLDIDFNPAVLKPQETRMGDFMQNGGALAKLIADTGSSSDGRITIEVQQDGGSGVEGSGALATVQFKAVSTGASTIFVSRAEFVGDPGQSVVFRAPTSVVVKVEP